MFSVQVFAASVEISAAFNLIDEAQKEEIINSATTDVTPMITYNYMS